MAKKAAKTVSEPAQKCDFCGYTRSLHELTFKGGKKMLACHHNDCVGLLYATHAHNIVSSVRLPDGKEEITSSTRRWARHQK